MTESASPTQAPAARSVSPGDGGHPDVPVIPLFDEVTGLARAASDPDSAVGLRAVAALRRLVEVVERAQVARAREAGWSWQQIADQLGVSRQAVHKKHGRD